MVRERVIQTIRYGYFREARDGFEELIRLCREKGLRAATCWAPVAGVANELILETEYESLAEFEREEVAFYSDADIMKRLRDTMQYVIEGSGRSELLESAPALA